MEQHILTYGQPRRASFNPTRVIFEKKEDSIEVPDVAAARKAARKFLKSGRVRCDSKIYRRVRISLLLLQLPDTPAHQPKPEFIPEYPAN
jgi:hypothetical protein